MPVIVIDLPFLGAMILAASPFRGCLGQSVETFRQRGFQSARMDYCFTLEQGF